MAKTDPHTVDMLPARTGGSLWDRLLRIEFIHQSLLRLPCGDASTLRFRLRERSHRARLASQGQAGYLADTEVRYPQHVTIGSGVSFGGRVAINALGPVTIGDDCMIAFGCVLTTATHDPDLPLMKSRTLAKPISIGSNVWLGAKALILPGVTIADGVVVAAGAVVNRSILTPNVIVAGVPARVVRKRGQARPHADAPASQAAA